MVNKLRHFLLHLVMLKIDSVWKPHMYIRDMHALLDKQHVFSPSPWLDRMVKASERVHAKKGRRQDGIVEKSYTKHI